jgi:hypothetical protein
VPPNDTERVLSELSRNELKVVIKAAIKEWLDEQALNFGKWTIRWLAMAGFGLFLYFILTAQGWHKT